MANRSDVVAYRVRWQRKPEMTFIVAARNAAKARSAAMGKMKEGGFCPLFFEMETARAKEFDDWALWYVKEVRGRAVPEETAKQEDKEHEEEMRFYDRVEGKEL